MFGDIVELAGLMELNMFFTQVLDAIQSYQDQENHRFCINFNGLGKINGQKKRGIV